METFIQIIKARIIDKYNYIKFRLFIDKINKQQRKEFKEICMYELFKKH
jgi:hypothetical protein